jgi:hypothetical protein
VAAPLAAAVLVVEPVLAAIALGAGFVLLALEAPIVATGLFLFAHVATPGYVRAPIPGGIYAPPLSTTLLLALVGVGALLYFARARMPGALGPGGRRVVGALAVFAVVAATSLIDPRTGSEGLGMWTKVFVLPTIALVLIVCACRSSRDIERLTKFLMAGAVAASSYAIVEYALGRNPLLAAYRSELDIAYFTSDVLGDIAYRCYSVYGNPLEFAMVMGMIFPFAATRMAVASGMRERIAYGIVAGIVAIGVALTFSRGPMLALIAGCILMGFIYRQLRPWLVGASIVTAIVLVLAWPFIGAGISDRINDVDNMTLRLKLWETALVIFSEHPLRGVGIGNFPQYYLEALRVHHVGPFHEFGPGRIELIRVAENTYLQLAAETGVLGVLAGFSAILVMLAVSIRLSRRAGDARARDLATAIAVSIVIYAANGAFVTAYTFYFATLLLIGVLPGCLLVLDRAEAAPAPADAGPRLAPSMR